MRWKKRIFGPGPERLTSVFFNELEDQNINHQNVLTTRAGGVIIGCEPNFSEEGKFSIGPGAVISAGKYFELEEGLSINEFPEATMNDHIWLYIDENGELNHTGQSWPDHISLGEVQNSYCVLGIAMYRGDEEYLEDGKDIRRFVQTKPNDAELVVGDVAAGADFEDLHQALGYLEACDMGNKKVSRRVVVTRDIDIDEPVQVRLAGVTLEGSISESVSGGVSATDMVTLTCVDTFSGSAAFELNENPDFSISGFEFVSETSSPVTYIFKDAGDRLCVQRCSTEGGFIWGVKTSGVKKGLRIESNELYFTGFSPSYPAGLLKLVSRGDCVQKSILRKNTISSATTSGVTENDEDSYVPLVDCGVNDEQCFGNRIEDNILDGGRVSIRVGRKSRVHNNRITGVNLYGVWVDSEALPVATATTTVHGGTSISNNVIELGDDSDLPWWRSGVRLEMTNCKLAENTIKTHGYIGCGISEGCVQGLHLTESSPTADQLSVLRVASNELAHGQITLTNSGGTLGVTPSTTFTHDDAPNVEYRPDRVYSTTESSMTIFVVAKGGFRGPQGYLEKGNSDFTVSNYTGTIDTATTATRLSGIYDVFRNVPIGGHSVRGNEIDFSSDSNPDTPVTGFGVLLLSNCNRVSNNKIKLANTGIFVLDGSTISENIVNTSWFGIIAWRRCSISSNEIWWFRDLSELPADHPFFLSSNVSSGILVSLESTLSGNKIYGLDSGADFSFLEPKSKWLTRDGGGSSSSSSELSGFEAKLFELLNGIGDDIDKESIYNLSTFLSNYEAFPPEGSSSSSSTASTSSSSAGSPSSSSSSSEPPWLMPDPEFQAAYDSLVEQINEIDTNRHADLLNELLAWGTSIEAHVLDPEATGDRADAPPPLLELKNRIYSYYYQKINYNIGTYEPALAPAVALFNVPVLILTSGFGATALWQEVLKLLDVLRQEVPGEIYPAWLFVNWGGNIVADNLIDLHTDEPLQTHTGIVSTAGGYGTPPVSPIEQLNLEYGHNVISSNSVRGGMVSYSTLTHDLVRDCRFEEASVAGIYASGRIGPNIEGCEVSGRGVDTEDGEAFCAVQISEQTLFTSIGDTTLRGKLPWVAAIHGDFTRISDCRIENEELYGRGISWGGNFGSCVGCDFYCMHMYYDDPIFEPAIVFRGEVNGWSDFQAEDRKTQGNLVAGAQMAGCFPEAWPGEDTRKVNGIRFEIGCRGKHPIWNHGTNFSPPILEMKGGEIPMWTNRVDWRSCWFWSYSEYILAGIYYLILAEIMNRLQAN